MLVARYEQCVDCGKNFVVSLDEFIKKLDNGMKLPKRCTNCRKKNRINADPFKGLKGIMFQYPSTKGHRHKVHGCSI